MLNSKVYTKKCVICGKEYKSISVRALTCGKQCRNEYHRRKYREKRSIKTCNNNSISEVLEKAREAGMSYGKYVAMEDKKEILMEVDHEKETYSSNIGGNTLNRRMR